VQRGYYRSKEEEQEWRTNSDPIKLLSARLLEQRAATPTEIAQIEQRVQAEIEAGVQFALNATYPDPSEVTQHVYA
jgi:pyruvate dehydrogenase E1 component alpha subunit